MPADNSAFLYILHHCFVIEHNTSPHCTSVFSAVSQIMCITFPFILQENENNFLTCGECEAEEILLQFSISMTITTMVIDDSNDSNKTVRILTLFMAEHPLIKYLL